MPLTTDRLKRIQAWTRPTFGADPELFIAKKGEIIGAEKVIPAKGVENGKIVLDGVQVELHPQPDPCRARLANDFRHIFTKLRDTLSKQGAEPSFEPVITVSKEEMKTLSKAARTLGCAPSDNLQDPTAKVKVSKGFRGRSAGGHIHVGFTSWKLNQRFPLAGELRKLIMMMDILVGLPSVFIDRDPNAAKRRRVYGRASEHRQKSYGFEYRTLSNFWLRSYQLMSFVFGMTRMATNIYGHGHPAINRTCHDLGDWNAADELLRRVSIDEVWKAINKNSSHLAMKQWKRVEEFIEEFYQDTSSGLSTGEPLNNFRHFIKKIDERGIEYWFPDDPMDHWCSLLEGHALNDDGFAGWETFLATVVVQDRIDTSIDSVIDKLRKVA